MTKKFLTILPAQVMREERLGSVTKTARAEEEERLSRLGRFQQEELPGFDLLLPIFTLHLVLTQRFLSQTHLDAFFIALSCIMSIFRVAEDEEQVKENKVEAFSIINRNLSKY